VFTEGIPRKEKTRMKETSHEVWLRARTRDHLRRLYDILQQGMIARTGKPAIIQGSTNAPGLYQVTLFSENGDDLRAVLRIMQKARLITIREIDVTHF
jgi:hypothetical protein